MYPTNVDHQQNIFKIGNPSGEPGQYQKKKKKKIISKRMGRFSLFCTKKGALRGSSMEDCRFFLNIIFLFFVN